MGRKKLSFILTSIVMVIIYIIEVLIAILMIVSPIVEFIDRNIISGIISFFGWPLAFGIITFPVVILGLKDFNFKQLEEEHWD